MSSVLFPARLDPPQANEVHVWTVRISEATPDLDWLTSVLSPAEHARAERFFRLEDRVRFNVSHGGLRRLLAAYGGGDPAGVTFTESKFGKPALADSKGLQFNMAHSGDVVMYAMTANRVVGVDVEAARPNVDFLEVSGQFAPEEHAVIRAAEGADRVAAFYRCWARKEAYLKARGEGLGYPLNAFAVTVAPGLPPRLEWASDDAAAASRWTMFDVSPGSGYAGAVVVEGGGLQLTSRRLPGSR